MQFILTNCTPKLQAMGINPSIQGWENQLSTKLSSYLTYDGWTYSYDTDTLIVTPTQGSTVSLNLTDFGDAGGVTL